MDASDLTVTVARLSIRLSRVIEFLGAMVMILMSVLVRLIGGISLCAASLYYSGVVDPGFILIGEALLLVAVYLFNKALYKRLVKHFYSA